MFFPAHLPACQCLTLSAGVTKRIAEEAPELGAVTALARMLVRGEREREGEGGTGMQRAEKISPWSWLTCATKVSGSCSHFRFA